VMVSDECAKDLERVVFPTDQGGQLMHIIAAKAVCLKEALEDGFKEYQQQVIRNAKVLADGLGEEGFRVVSGGTDNHLMLVDVFVRGLTGAQAEKTLERAGITVNKNAIPFHTQPPMKASGIRIGTPALTTRGMKEPEMRQIAGWIGEALAAPENESIHTAIREKVRTLSQQFPIYEKRLVRSREATG